MTNFLLSAIIVVFLPVAIVLSNLRIFINPWFPIYEYTRVGFPEDLMGMDNETRSRLAVNSVRYLVNNADISYLSQDRDQFGNIIYNDRELDHMEDVKFVVGRVLGVWKISLVMVIGAFIWLYLKPDTDDIIKQSVKHGSGVIIVCILGLLAYILINFDSFFTTFHQIFFERGTWTFSYTDMLIRLFPPKFWSDIAIFIAATSLFEGLLLWWAARYT